MAHRADIFTIAQLSCLGTALTGQTGQRIFALDSSNDADSRKDVPLGGSLRLLPILAVKSPPNKIPILGA